MPSIRRTLIVSLLILFATALACVAVLLDRLAAQSLDVRAKVEAQSIENEFQERCREERDKLDQQLLNEARTIGSQMQSMYAVRFEQELNKFRTAYSLAEHLAQSDLHTGLGWAGGNARGWVFFMNARVYFANLHLDNSFGQGDSEADHDPHPRLVQIFIASRTDSVWRSKSLGDASFPRVRQTAAPDKLIDWQYDNVTVNGESVRRVVFRSPIFVQWVRSGPPPRGGGRGGGRATADRPSPAPPPSPPDPPTPAQIIAGLPRLAVHCARSVAVIEPDIAQHREDRDDRLDQLDQTIRAERFTLRSTVIGIGAAALVIILAGGAKLVRRGLKPVDRLSEAVGRVSEKDFRLPIGQAELSQELAPIHARLTETLDQLRRAFEREKQAVADISHELRTPVAALLTTLDVSLRKPRSAEQYRQTLEECRAITRQLGQLVERVMTLAYLDAGQVKPKSVRVDGGEVAAGCAAVIRPLAQAHGLMFRLNADEPVELDTDPDKLREVLMNLLHNAVEYNSPGGTVNLSVRRANGAATFEVRDSGIGMTPDVRARIFERFYRADPSRTQTGVHAGLGLAIVKEYIDRLGGTVRVESEPGRGSAFRVELPAAEPAEEPAIASA